MTILYLQGDATQPTGPEPKYLLHIVNDVGLWGRGFVLAISRRWPEPERSFRAASPLSLGTIQIVPVKDDLSVVNLCAQRGVRSASKKAPIRYDALETALRKAADRALRSEASFHTPRIGTGLAGGEWARVEDILLRTQETFPLPVYVYDLSKSLA